MDALADREAEALGTGGRIDEARDRGRGELVDVGDAVIADEGGLGEQLREIEVGDGGVVDGQVRLVAERRARIEQPRLERLRDVAPEEARRALEDEAAVDREGRHGAARRTVEALA